MAESPPTGIPRLTLPQRAKPFLRRAGSKRKQLNRLAHFWSDKHARYVEPFAGSACLFFELAPARAILGDSNEGLIEVYRTVRDVPDRLYDRLCRIKRDEDTYYRWRKKPPEKLDPETRALRFLYLNRNCFNGIFRTNTLGQFNVPFGIDPGSYFSRADLRLCSSLLQNAEFMAGDFALTLEKIQAGARTTRSRCSTPTTKTSGLPSFRGPIRLCRARCRLDRSYPRPAPSAAVICSSPWHCCFWTCDSRRTGGAVWQEILRGGAQMTAAELRAVGERLYGPCWQTKLARALPVKTLTICYWLVGKRAIRPLVAERIRAIVADNRTLRRVAGKNTLSRKNAGGGCQRGLPYEKE